MRTHPVFNRFTGEVMGGCERARFRELELYQWKTPNDPKSGAAVLTVEGEYWYYFNDIAKDAKGLTDMQGPLERNRTLSRDRAAAVIAALVKNHGITVDRLSVDGVGPLAPAASNADETATRAAAHFLLG